MDLGQKDGKFIPTQACHGTGQRIDPVTGYCVRGADKAVESFCDTLKEQVAGTVIKFRPFVVLVVSAR